MEVLFLDDDDDLRDVLGTLLVSLGHQCICISSYAELDSLGEQALKARLALLDINLGAGVPSGLDAHRWLVDHHFAGRIVFISGHGRMHPLVVAASQLGEAVVLQKPVTIEALDSLLSNAQGAR